MSLNKRSIIAYSKKLIDNDWSFSNENVEMLHESKRQEPLECQPITEESDLRGEFEKQVKRSYMLENKDQMSSNHPS